MRILYHHRTLGDGAEGIHIAEMVAAFRGLGHVVDVEGLAGPGVSEPRGRSVARIKGAMPRPVFEAAAIGTNAMEYLAVRRGVRRQRPDLLYARHARFACGAVEAARRAGVPVVLEVNCLFTAASYRQFEPMVFERWAAAFERRAIAAADVVLAVSTPLARQIREMSGVSAEVMPNGADPDRFDPVRHDGRAVRMRLGLGDSVVVGWAGVLRAWHGLDALVEAVAKMPGVRLLIVGDGPARTHFARQAAYAGISDRVHITGRVPSDEMPDFIAAFDIAVVASERTGIASPMKLPEYMSMERAIVAPRLANMLDIVEDGHSAVLFADGDSGNLAMQLQRLAEDGELRKTLGRNARRTVTESRNWVRNAERVTELVQKHRHKSV